MILPVVMAGGSGTRLWPLSRKNHPKQFLALDGSANNKKTMLQQTIMRLDGIDHSDPIIICNEEHRFMVAEQLRQENINHNGILLEPAGRNTAPAIALAAFKALADGKDPLLLVLAADHVIYDTEAFQQAVLHAKEEAEAGKMVTFGIVAQTPETGYGYIKRGAVVQRSEGEVVNYLVDQFVEKPNLATAAEYVDSGKYYWNSGMFMFKASRYLAALENYQSAIYNACKQAMQDAQNDFDFVRADEEAFLACPDDSIDYAVMEPLCSKANGDVVVVPMDAKWNDVGGFSALWNISDKDEAGNAIEGDVKLFETKNTLIRAENKLIATVGVEDLVIIDTKDVVLVAHKDKSQYVKEIVKQLKQENRPEVTFHREVYRPWGAYDSIDNGERFQVKRITVKPGAKLSVQMHHHRAEHWIVVSGTAKVTNGDKEILLTENQSTYIPIGVIHALENPGVIELELIEVQSGSYLGEDDIVRFDDKYGRS